MRTATNAYYLLSDVMGSTHALVDGSGQLVGSHYRYEPYGEQISGPSVANPIRFQGQHLDSQTGLYKMGLRYYDPTIGRWTQKDPLNLYQDPRQANRYAFAGSDPITNADPSGLHTLCDSQGCKAVCGIDEDFGDPACQILTGGGNVEACIEGGAKAAGGSLALRSIFSGRFRPPNPLSLLFGCARGAFLESL
jgi:RHS repeat-associated protein